jgi:Rod binding domain-containing protein
MSNVLPPIQSALLPKDVRKAGPKAERIYQTALAFESVLIQQLTKSLGSTLAGGTGAPDNDTADAASALTAQMIPDALSQSLTGSGGIGLARQLYEALGGGDNSTEAEPAAGTADDRSMT